MKKMIYFLVVLISFLPLYSQTTLFTYGTNWKYLDNGINQGTAWRNVGFPDGSWASGNGQFGYGDGDETTVISFGPDGNNKYITTYFRKEINIASVAAFTNFQFNMLRDDGVVIYVNGVEVYRNNMNAGTVNYPTFSATNCADDGNTIQTTTLTLAASQFVNGNNTIAVEIHQTNLTSSDLTFDMELLGISGGAGGTITRGPYIQTLTPTSVILRWRTNNSVDGKVCFGTDSTNLSSQVTVAGNTTEHTVQLSGLTPYTKYFYSIGTTTGVIQSSYQNFFKTAPTTGTEGFYRFFVTGDCGNNSTNQTNVRTRYNNYVGNGITNGWLLLGDNAYNGGLDNEFTTNFFNIYQGTVMKNAPLWPCPGNHDYDNNSANQDSHNIPYYSIFNVPANAEAGGVASNTEAFYSYNYGNIHFLALDSYGEESNMRLYDTSGAQAVWIKQDLDANTLPWVVAYWHHPPYTKGSHNSDTEGELINMRQNFIKILERYGVDLILCGHSHSYERSKLMKGHYGNEASFNAATHHLNSSTGLYDGTTNSCPYMKDDQHSGENGTVYVVSGSSGSLGGTTTGYPHNAMYYSNTTNGGSLVLEFNGNRLDAKWLCSDGVIRDKFTIVKNANQVHHYTIDLGDTLDLTASWNGQYNWPHSGQITPSVQVIPSATVNYTATDQYACIRDSFMVNVNIPVITPDVVVPAICEGTTFNLSVPYTANGHFWPGSSFIAEISDANGSFASPVNIGTLSSTTSGTISATIPGTLPSGSGYLMRIVSSIPAITSSSIPVTINPLPVASAANTGPYCDGTTIQLNSTGGETYSWSGPSAYSDGNQNPSILSSTIAHSGVYTVTVTATGCSSTTTTIVTVHPNPSIPLISSNGPTTFCDGNSVTLTSSYPTGNNWNTSASTQGIAVDSSGVYTVTHTDVNGCTASSSQMITVNANPSAPIISTSGPTTFCDGGNVDLSSSYLTGNTWNTSSTDASIHVTNAGNYTVVFTDVNGCTSSSSQSVTVDPNPSAPTITPDGPLSFCEGGSVTLSSSYSSGNSWSTTETTQAIIADSSAPYAVLFTDVNGCTSTAAVTVTEFTNPTTPLITTNTGSTSFCAGNSLVLNSSYLNNNNWSTSASTSSIMISTAGNYSVTYTDANGCTSSASENISENPNPATPVITPNGPTVFCEGGSVILTSSYGTGNSWSTTETTQAIVADTSASYTVLYTDINGCTSTAAVTVTEFTNPTIPLITTNTGSTSFCAGNSLVLNSSYLNNNNWSTSASTSSIMISTAGNYSVTYTDANGCTSSASENISENPNPATPVITSNDPTVFCEGGSVTLTSSYTTGNSWSTSETTNSIQVTSSGTYTVTETDANGCTSSSSQIVLENPLPAVSLQNFNTVCVTYPQVPLSGGSPLGGDYSGPAVTGNQFNPVIAGIGTFTITYTYTDANGCTNNAVASIVVSPCLDIQENGNEYLISAYPNPFSDMINISYHLNTAKEISIELVDMSGKVLDMPITSQVKEIGDHTLTIHAHDYPFTDGVYFVKLITEGKIEVIKINYVGK